MNKLVASSPLAVAVCLALAAQALPVKAQVSQETMERVAKYKLEKCYGIAAKGTGQATVDRDKGSFAWWCGKRSPIPAEAGIEPSAPSPIGFGSDTAAPR